MIWEAALGVAQPTLSLGPDLLVTLVELLPLQASAVAATQVTLV